MINPFPVFWIYYHSNLPVLFIFHDNPLFCFSDVFHPNLLFFLFFVFLPLPPYNKFYDQKK